MGLRLFVWHIMMGVLLIQLKLISIGVFRFTRKRLDRCRSKLELMKCIKLLERL